MGLPSQTAKSLARIIVEKIGDAKKASDLLESWNEVRGTNGNFRMTISDVLVFVKKMESKEVVNK